jgi:dephospho-CoA kinase
VLRVGLTGGLASGKSTAGAVFAALGCFVIKADEIGHRLLHSSGAAFGPVAREFGPQIVRDGEIDRRALARIVFSQPERLERLNTLVHPLVFEEEDRLMAEAAARDPHGIGMIEAAILIETGAHRRCDKLVVAACPVELQVSRAMARDGMTEKEARDRIARQMPLPDKMKLADFIIDTSGTLEDTAAQTRRVYQLLRSLNR